MRITGPKGNTGVSSKPKTSGKSASGSSFQVSDANAPASAKNVGALRSLAAVDALVSIQEVPDATARRAKAIARAENILEVLEEIKIALLSGSLPRSRVARLTRLVQDLRSDEEDEGLAQVLDEIDLRARVELAKLEKAA